MDKLSILLPGSEIFIEAGNPEEAKAPHNESHLRHLMDGDLTRPMMTDRAGSTIQVPDQARVVQAGGRIAMQPCKYATRHVIMYVRTYLGVGKLEDD